MVVAIRADLAQGPTTWKCFMLSGDGRMRRGCGVDVTRMLNGCGGGSLNGSDGYYTDYT
ncbi:hypothetical protein MSG28_014031 [Choristoneura fumiferana]|uniref:Uncharacterized protein n=1 Tax=Choristoneura fumiferana TaxID=7141 RepID=A0ACC0JFT1_CHOFU|nr:hypothetical protein MSG28_014031 [Choristoneura fumiferana]